MVELYEEEFLTEKIDLAEDFVSFESNSLFIDPSLAGEMDPHIKVKHELYKVLVEYNQDPFFLCFFLEWYCRWYDIIPPNSPFMVAKEVLFDRDDNYDEFVEKNQDEFDRWVVDVIASLMEKMTN